MRQLLKCAFLVVVFIGLAGDQVYTLGQGDPRLRPHRYFTQGKPVEGDFTHEWMDAKWYFASAANRTLSPMSRSVTRRNMADTAPGR